MRVTEIDRPESICGKPKSNMGATDIGLDISVVNHKAISGYRDMPKVMLILGEPE